MSRPRRVKRASCKARAKEKRDALTCSAGNHVLFAGLSRTQLEATMDRVRKYRPATKLETRLQVAFFLIGGLLFSGTLIYGIARLFSRAKRRRAPFSPGQPRADRQDVAREYEQPRVTRTFQLVGLGPIRV